MNYFQLSALASTLNPADVLEVYRDGAEVISSGKNYSGPLGDLNEMLNGGMLGASGAIFGILAGFGAMFPRVELRLLFPPITLTAKWFVLIYAGIELYLGFSGMQSGIAHFAHVGGALFGFLLILYWRRTIIL